MDLKPLKWYTMPAPTDPKQFPCMICRKALATHRRIIRRGQTTLNLVVCLECGRLSDVELWHLLESTTEIWLDRVVKRICD